MLAFSNGPEGNMSILRPNKSVYDNLKPNKFMKTRVYTVLFICILWRNELKCI